MRLFVFPGTLQLEKLMKKKIELIITSLVTVVLILGFWVYFPRIWGEVIYPLEYRDFIKKYSQEWDVKPNLVAAFIYTESHFNPKATSNVGARGLMQIMPATGRGIAEQVGESNFDTDKLFDPETNIKYGSWYIKDLLDHYPDNRDASIASYNAGIPRVDRWLEFGTPLPTETQNFIQKIKKAESSYDKIYGAWYNEVEIKKPSPFYEEIKDFNLFVRGLLTGK